MGVYWPLTFRAAGLLSLLTRVLPAVRTFARKTLSQAREQYHAGRKRKKLVPPVSRLDPVVLIQRVLSVPTGRLAQLLVEAQPMGP